MLEVGVQPMFGFDVNTIFISNHNSLSVQFSARIQCLCFFVGWHQANIEFWCQPDFHFQPKFSVCPLLEADIKPTLGFDVNTVFIFNQNVIPMLEVSELEVDLRQTLGFDVNLIFIFNLNSVSVQCWRLTSGQRWVLTSPDFILNQNTTSVQCWKLKSDQYWVLTSIWFSFLVKIQCLSSVRGWHQANTGFWYFFNQNATSVQYWTLTSTWFSF